MSIRTLKMIANAGEPDDTLALRIDVVAAAVRLTESMNNTTMSHVAWCDEKDKLTAQLQNITNRYLRSCVRRNKRMSGSGT